MAFSSYWVDDPSDISHYGVKGMKWGVRKAEKRRYKHVSQAKHRLKLIEAPRPLTRKRSNATKKPPNEIFAKKLTTPSSLINSEESKGIEKL